MTVRNDPTGTIAVNILHFVKIIVDCFVELGAFGCYGVEQEFSHGAVLLGKLTFPRVTENDSMKASSPGDESRLKSKVTLGSVQPSK